MRRAFTTPSSLGWVIGACLVATLALQRPQTSSATVGPFRVEVEQCRLVRGETPRVYVQLHLYRPTGPVPIFQRVRIDGPVSLGSDWELTDAEWLIKNEWMNLPPGDYLSHPVLGRVPATRHAGEARGVFEFTARNGLEPSRLRLTYRLPDGDLGVFFITPK